MFRWQGKQREMGLGSATNVTLARARELAASARDALAQGRDPLEARDADRLTSALPAPAEPQPARITFGQCADELLRNLDGSWANSKHAAQWAMTLREYAAPLRPIPINEVRTDDVIKVLQPIWRAKPETASRLRGRIERVLSFAKAMGYRGGENPALWRGHLDQILPRRDRLTRGHHKALALSDLQNFMEDLRAREAVAARALEFAILTAGRSGEVLGARWSEMDFAAAVWTIPASRMKGKREHRVPLSPASLALLERMAAKKRGDFIFPTQRSVSNADAALSSMSMEMLLRRMEQTVTVHGFRSTFRDWTAECTGYANEVCEAALAHVISNKAEAAYRRGDMLEKRRNLMADWATYCSGNG
jgi:integrase